MRYLLLICLFCIGCSPEAEVSAYTYDEMKGQAATIASYKTAITAATPQVAESYLGSKAAIDEYNKKVLEVFADGKVTNAEYASVRAAYNKVTTEYANGQTNQKKSEILEAAKAAK